MGLSLLRAVPLWAWALLACLAWGGIQHHRATAAAGRLAQERAEIVAERERALARSVAETERRRAAQEVVTREAQDAARRARADAAAADRARAGVLKWAAALAADADSCRPAPAAGSAPAASPGLVLADVFGRSDGRAGELAAALDEAHAAGRACERAYDALTTSSH